MGNLPAVATAHQFDEAEPASARRSSDEGLRRPWRRSWAVPWSYRASFVAQPGNRDAGWTASRGVAASEKKPACHPCTKCRQCSLKGRGLWECLVDNAPVSK